MSLLGRLVHYSIDAVLLSTVLAGVRRSSGFNLDTEKIGDPTIRSVADRFLGIGETAFNYAQVTAAGSSYFKRATRER